MPLTPKDYYKETFGSDPGRNITFSGENVVKFAENYYRLKTESVKPVVLSNEMVYRRIESYKKDIHNLETEISHYLKNIGKTSDRQCALMVVDSSRLSIRIKELEWARVIITGSKEDTENRKLISDVADKIREGSYEINLSEKEEVKETGWISINDRLPEYKKSVIFHYKDGYTDLGDIQELEGKTCLCTNDGYILLSDSRITHWMPEPEPPKD